MKVYATYNIKGGVGKTSAAVNLAHLAALDGHNVLLWDLDPQGAATYMFRVRPKVKGGGRALVQPIHQDDVTRCVCAALAVAWDGPHAMVIAGPSPLPYADFVRAVAAAAGLRRPRLLSVPAWLLRAAAPLTALPGLPRIRGEEIRRLLEDKAFPIAEMIATLGVRPVPLHEGLARTFARGTGPHLPPLRRHAACP